MKTLEPTGTVIRLKDYQSRASAAQAMTTTAPGARFPLKAAREYAKLTETEAAALLQITLATLRKWETGETAPAMDKAIKLSGVYGLPLENLAFSKADNQQSTSDGIGGANNGKC